MEGESGVGKKGLRTNKEGFFLLSGGSVLVPSVHPDIIEYLGWEDLPSASW